MIPPPWLNLSKALIHPSNAKPTNTNEINFVASHCELEALHRMVFRASGAAIFLLLGLIVASLLA
jgi:hypothetical protein